MQATLVVTKAQVITLMKELISRDVKLDTVNAIQTHEATMRGLVTDDNRLVAVIASDIAFAHKTGAALAMIPAGIVQGKGDQPDDEYIELYYEVANVLSRLVNEAHPTRLRIDPGLKIPSEQLIEIMEKGRPVVLSTVTVDGYGEGDLGIWYKPE